MVSQKFQYFRFLEVESKGTHGDFELVVVDTAVLVGVEQLERLLDLLLLLVCELWSRVCATLGLLRGR